jgi:hypothetical protein
MDLTTLLVDAGLRLRVADGQLQVRGRRAAEATAKRVLRHKKVVTDWISTGRVVLDWADRSHVLRHPALCVRCSHPTFLADADGRPCHKVCAERETTKLLDTLTGARW